ncbi:MAG: ABC transporter permease subunit [Treponema sp.]|jgi:NitT/TauT family transport system permease protein|nr:ABC transporter permease subunit [Treponema sp.]
MRLSIFPKFSPQPLWSVLGICFLLAAWECAARFMGSELILPGPLPSARRLLLLLKDPRFTGALLGSFGRVLLGMFISAPLGILAGLAAGLDRRAGAFLQPFFTMISAAPVMALILILFLWFGQEKTPVFTAFLMVFPVMAANAGSGLRALDPKLAELFQAYGLSPAYRLRYLYLPSLLPFILGGLRSSLSLSWKVVVAAEVLVQPRRALGTGMQAAKAQLETPELFAWTAAAVMAAAFSQFLLSVLLALCGNEGKR